MCVFISTLAHYACIHTRSQLNAISASSLNEGVYVVGSKPERHHGAHLRGWRRYFYEVSWPSVVISAFLVYLSHYVDMPDYENWSQS